MAKDRRKLQHIHSSIPDKQPTPQSLEVGEIAVNNANKKEFLSIKNSQDKVVRFSSDEQMITWMEKKEVMPYIGQVRGEVGPTGTIDDMGSYGITNDDLLQNKSNLIVKLNQVAASNTKEHDKVNAAKDIYDKEVNPTSDSGLTGGAGFAINMSRYAMIGANPSFSSLTVTDKTDLSGNTTISNGDGTGTRTGHTLTINTTDVNSTNTNWNETITNKSSKVTTLNESATTRTTKIGTENLNVSGTTTEVHTGDVSINNKANVTATTDGNEIELIKGNNYRDVNGNYSGTTGGTTTEVKTGAVNETNSDTTTITRVGDVTETDKAARTLNVSGASTTNVSGDVVSNTTGTTTELKIGNVVENHSGTTTENKKGIVTENNLSAKTENTTGVLTENNSSNHILNTTGTTDITRTGAVTETNGSSVKVTTTGNYSGTTGGTTTEVKVGNVVENHSGTTTLNYSGATTANITGNSTFNITGNSNTTVSGTTSLTTEDGTTIKTTNGNTVIDTTGATNINSTGNITVQATGSGSDMGIYANDVMTLTATTMNITGSTASTVKAPTNTISGTTTNIYGATTLTMTGATVNTTGTTLNSTGQTVNISGGTGGVNITGATKVNGNLTVTGNTNTSGNTNVGGALNVTGNTTIGGTLKVTGCISGACLSANTITAATDMRAGNVSANTISAATDMRAGNVSANTISAATSASIPTINSTNIYASGTITGATVSGTTVQGATVSGTTGKFDTIDVPGGLSKSISFNYESSTGYTNDSYNGSESKTIHIPSDASHIARRTVSWSYGSVTSASAGSYDPAQTSNGSFVIPSSLSHISSGHSHSWSTTDITDKPTTIAGYGITDAYTKTESNSNFVNLSGDTMTGNLTAPAFYATSDERLKENIENVSYSKVANAASLSIKSFNFKADETKKTVIGVIAQEVEKANLEFAVVTGEDGMKAVDYTSICLLKIAYLEEKIKELDSIIKELKDNKQ